MDQYSCNSIDLDHGNTAPHTPPSTIAACEPGARTKPTKSGRLNAMPRLFAMPLALILTALPLTASAQNGAPDTENGRYSFNRVEDGFLRLDQRTGQVSVCARRDLGWSCHPV